MKTSEAQRRATQNYRERQRQKGLCCLGDGRPLAPDSEWYCEYHLEKFRGSKFLREKQGLCSTCGLRPPTPDHKTCTRCRARQSAANQKRATERRTQGLCARCGKEPLAPTSTWYGENCLEDVRRRMKRKVGLKARREPIPAS